MKIFNNPESRNQPFVIFLGFVLIGMIGVLDYLTGYELAFSVFYVFPIFLVTWAADQRTGYVASLMSAIIWFWADTNAGHPYSHPLYPYWNSLIRLAFFGVITFLLSALKTALLTERELSNTDYLTLVANSRRFYEIIQMEINRLERNPRPFTVAYIDIDNFKTINDTFGHSEGDLVLKKIVGAIAGRLRKSDLVARLGGDEFAIFLPETDQETARLIFPKLQETLLDEMRQHDWKVTFSIGVVTCAVSPRTVNDLIRTADDLMYSVKRTGKNMIKYSIYGEADRTAEKEG